MYDLCQLHTSQRQERFRKHQNLGERFMDFGVFQILISITYINYLLTDDTMRKSHVVIVIGVLL